MTDPLSRGTPAPEPVSPRGPPDSPTRRWPALAADAVRALPASLIREVANAALGQADVLPFWFGEPDEITPAIIRDAAKRALDEGDTFYQHNLGIPALRQALADDQSRRHPPMRPDRIVVTSSGVSALMLAAQAILRPGDRVVAVVPLWPNLGAIASIAGAGVDRVALELDPAARRWRLDFQRLLDAIGPDTRAVLLNSPNNPTGWTIPPEQLRCLIEYCRAHGVWLISDESYDRIVFDGSACAPSALDHATPEDRVIVTNTFSKTWRMTGWRLGWMTVPPTLVDDIGKLIEFSTSCAPGFVQRAGLAALNAGDSLISGFVEQLRVRRDVLIDGLVRIDGISLGVPDGAMYVFLRLRDQRDSLGLAKRLVREARLGLAPGVAFGREGEGYLRWCFARSPSDLREGVERLAAAVVPRQ